MSHVRATEGREEMFVRSACLESAPRGAGPVGRSFWGAGESKGPARLHLLKQKMLRGALERTAPPQIHKQLCGAANVAAQVAWETAFPLLSFPCLFEEMARGILSRFSREALWAGGLESSSAVEPEGAWLSNEMPLAA